MNYLSYDFHRFLYYNFYWDLNRLNNYLFVVLNTVLVAMD